MKPKWTLGDLLDLEFFFQADESLRRKEGAEALRKRDRIIYLSRIAPRLTGVDPHPTLFVKEWLLVRRHGERQAAEEDVPSILPSRMWQEFSFLFACFALVFGLVTGLGLAAGFLVYTGKSPLNVSAFLGLFVLLQLFFILLQAIFLLIRFAKRARPQPLLISSLLWQAFTSVANLLRNRAQNKMLARQRLELNALLGRVKSRRDQAGLWIFPPFLAIQLAGIGFNLAVLGATLAKVVFSDMAFGWQSSLPLSAHQIASVAHFLALPWAWFLPEGLGFPSLAQVEGSQIILKDGMYHLATQNLVSWWPFLCMAITVYGLLPRIILFAAGTIRQRQLLNKLELNSPEVRRLLERMTMAQIETGGTAVPTEVLHKERSQQKKANLPPAWRTSKKQLGHNLLLVPEEIFPGLVLNELNRLLVRQTGMGYDQIFQLPFATDGEKNVLAALVEAKETSGVNRLFLLQEAWMPPLKESMTFLQGLRSRLGGDIPITILLMGKPGDEVAFSPARREHEEIWIKKIEAMADPFLEARSLVDAT